ncbi:hypothetical protein DCS32_14530 [Dokdonia sp. Dokd-P16]|uniref:OmpA family protein n=1 Tax=Dokdonia sp. Dokd-P16 TaxID=2173169 RepID=UPI000D544724|nr:OmpA family protein [Dokdonia sp. Dokd-P16]AWH75337.1 hypothetical protein DCS32_14530 [Dokdonia sp. Dokd-P16]
MKGFFGAFFVFLLWTSGCIYFVSTREATSDSAVQQIVEEKDNSEKSILNPKDQQSPPREVSKTRSTKTRFAPDSLDLYGIEHETSSLLAEEIQKSIAISDTIDITKDEPALEFEKELNSFMGPSFSSNIFYPRYNNTDLILDKELVEYATELRQLLKENPDKKVTILGHTDNVGSSKDNFNQGLKMSRQVKWYLTARRGIPRRKITATSRGEEEPIANNETLSGRQENNRIEIIVD